jgi:uncharacterized phage protein gp47/JayE
MFEAYTYDHLLKDVLANAPPGIDTRPGSIFYDAVSGILLKVAKLYADLDFVSELVFIETASGAFLDKRAEENGLSRLPAARCNYYVSFEGVLPNVGERFFADGLYFTLLKNDGGVYFLSAEEAGAAANRVYAGAPAVPLNNIDGLASATFGEIMELGTDAESDDDLRNRIREKIAGPAENGNRQHYKTWCESVEGVGRARIVPLWKGPNTVKGILLNALGTPADDAVVARVQAYIDPDYDGDGEGDGLGEGRANIGARFTAAAALEHTINASCTVTLTNGSTVGQAQTQMEEALREYLKQLTLDAHETQGAVVRIAAVGAMINGLPAVLDYGELELNADTSNINLNSDEAAVLGEASIRVL